MRRALAPVLLVFLAIGACDAEAARDARDRRDRDRGRDEQDIAREALQRGDVLPITRILAVVATSVPGEIVEVKLETRRTPLSYEVKVLTPSGVVREVEIDARTGVITQVEDD